MDKKLNFEEFAKAVQQYELHKDDCTTSAHHSNGSGRDWEAMQQILNSNK